MWIFIFTSLFVRHATDSASKLGALCSAGTFI
uniref:Uncharacterized protein n=1 Tax=Rhizophora mucronata TaxID=61149 RepID=A0A2P2P6C4_RHIMU